MRFPPGALNVGLALPIQSLERDGRTGTGDDRLAQSRGAKGVLSRVIVDFSQQDDAMTLDRVQDKFGIRVSFMAVAVATATAVSNPRKA